MYDLEKILIDVNVVDLFYAMIKKKVAKNMLREIF